MGYLLYDNFLAECCDDDNLSDCHLCSVKCRIVTDNNGHNRKSISHS